MAGTLDTGATSSYAEGVRQWLSRGWNRLEPGAGHPLGYMAGKRLGKATLQVLVGPRNRFGAQYFQLWLPSAEDGPMAGGLIHRGSYPAYNWMEVMSLEPPYEGRLLRLLGGAVPPGGHLMVEYDSPPRQETAAALSLGVPPVATPLGELLYRAGCGLSFKDWAIAEGGMEGPRKLQGFKPLDGETAAQRALGRSRELQGFLCRPPGPGHLRLRQAARRRAQRVLKSLEKRLRSSAGPQTRRP